MWNKGLTRTVLRIRLGEADKFKAEAEALKDTARLEDLQIWQMEKAKTTKKGSKTYAFWMAPLLARMLQGSQCPFKLHKKDGRGSCQI